MDPLKHVHFRCRFCGHSFEAEPDAVREDQDADSQHHPWRYEARCPSCGETAEQAPWERALQKAYTCSTGPRTQGGKDRVRENLRGHPTPEETDRTRFNALKHGLYARVATFYPAKPGKYPQCEGCEYRDTCGVSHRHCLKRAELYLKHHIAFETRDPGMLTELRADTQAGVQALINDMILTITQDGGPRLRSPEWRADEEGAIHLVRYEDDDGNLQQIYRHEAHPLLKHLMDFISKNTMTLADMGMTPKVVQEEEEERGHLEDKRKAREEFSEFQQRQMDQQQRLMQLIERGAPPAGRVIDAQDEDPGDG
ncbi:MAG: hypothetical protein ACLFSK_09150 [Ectothiorhodospira sp.]